MQKRLWIVALGWLLLSAGPTFAQTVVTGNEADKLVRHASAPLVCAAGDVYFNTVDNKAYKCGPANTWGSMGGGASVITTFDLLSPTAAETNLVQQKFPAAITITRVSCSVDSGTSVVIQFDERAEATPNTAGTNVLTGNLTCDTTNGGITTSFTNAGIAANAPLNLQIISSTANPNAVRIHVAYTID